MRRTAVSLLVSGALVAALAAAAWAGAGRASVRTIKSQVWAGYQAEGQTFASAAATWTLGQATCSGLTGRGDADSYTWVGLGSGATAERVAVREFCTGTLVAYAVYIEMNGLTEIQAVHPAAGDVISARVSYGAGKYRFSLVDSTQAKSFSSSYGCGAFSQNVGTCSRSLAEVGAGISQPHQSPLTDYGATPFSKIALVDAKGKHGSLLPNRFWRVSRVVEFDGGILAASPSPLEQRGTSFTDTWRAA